MKANRTPRRIASRLENLEAAAREKRGRYDHLLRPDPARDAKILRRLEDDPDGTFHLAVVAVKAAHEGPAAALRFLESAGVPDAAAVLGAAQEQQRATYGDRPCSPWARFDPDGRPYARSPF